MLKLIPAFLFFILYCNTILSESIPGTNIEEKAFELSIPNRDIPVRTINELSKQIDGLNTYIGSYPPKFSSEEQREQVFHHWLDLVADIEAYINSNPLNEKTMAAASELYRQGHNMDVMGSAEKANDILDSCLKNFPKSVACNLSASYFYLSIGTEFLGKAEHSLRILREYYSPQLNSEVESGYVFLYLYKQDVKSAKKQIDVFTENFPNSSRTKTFKLIKSELGDSIEYKEH